MRMNNLINQYNSRISEITNKNTVSKTKKSDNPVQSFEKILQQQINSKEVSFSKHAKLRIEQRDMNLSQEHIEKLNSAVNKADSKGVKDTLILMDQMAFIVNVPNKLVVTAMNGADIKENVFTQIDGAVIV